jgi:hypothetical protein
LRLRHFFWDLTSFDLFFAWDAIFWFGEREEEKERGEKGILQDMSSIFLEDFSDRTAGQSIASSSIQSRKFT